jgi:hypothetical protein
LHPTPGLTKLCNSKIFDFIPERKNMTMEKLVKAKEVRWDISDLYTRHDDTRVEADLQDAVARAERFSGSYRDKISPEDLAAETLYEAIVELEAIYAKIYKPEIYAFLAFTADTANDAIKALYARCQDLMAQVQNLVLFFELEVQKIPPAKFEQLLATGRLDTYRHYLEGVRLFTPYTLSEKEEQVINKKEFVRKTCVGEFVHGIHRSLHVAVGSRRQDADADRGGGAQSFAPSGGGFARAGETRV